MWGMTYDPSSRTLYAGATGMVYRSSDYGVTWRPCTKPDIANVETFMHIAVAGDSLYGFSGSGGQFNITSDAITYAGYWEGCRDFPRQMIQHGGQTFFTTGDGELGLRRVDYERRQCQTVNFHGRLVFCLVSDGPNLYASQDGIYVSRDTGVTWMKIFDKSAVALVVHGDFLFAFDGGFYYYRSIDAGATWEEIPALFAPISPHQRFANVGDTLYLLNQSFNGDERVFRSTDLGDNWHVIDSLARMPTSSHEGFIKGIDGHVLVGTSAGPYLLDNDEFVPSYSEWKNTWISSLYSSDAYLYAVAIPGLFRSNDNGRSWQQLSPHLFFVDDMSVDGERLAALTFYDPHVYVSDNHGVDWDTLSLPAPLPRGNSRAKILVVDSIVLIGYDATSNLYRSSDRGTTWEQIGIPLSRDTKYQYDRDTRELWATTSTGLYSSIDAGRIWNRRASFNSEKMTDLYIKGNFLLATTDSGVVRSTNFGRVWSHSIEGLPRLPSRLRYGSIAVNGDTLAIALKSTFYSSQDTAFGIYYSIDSGVTWKPNQGLRYVSSVTDIETYQGEWIAGTQGHGVLRSSSLTSQAPFSDARASLPSAVIEGVVPNPASGTARMAYRLQSGADVRLELHTLDGRVIRHLLNEHREAGRHSVEIETQGLPSGYYLCRLQTGAASSTYRLLLLR